MLLVTDMNRNSDKKIIIVGAGLCGTLLAIRMAQRGFHVALYEKRSDMRKGFEDAGRSINLALSDRGLLALELAGLKNTVLEQCIPIRGRMVHPLGEKPFLSPYSGRSSNYINSVSRSGLNITLLNEAEKFNNIEMHFNCGVVDVDLPNASIQFRNGKDEFQKDSGAIIIGTDGAGSVVRSGIMRYSTELLFNYSQDFLRHGYKELSMTPDKAGNWKLEKEVLHIYPRGDFMIIALPNLDGSFTLTMFHPYDTVWGFNNLQSKDEVVSFFEKFYPTLLPFIPHYLEEYFENPVGTLGTIKCYPWQAFGKALIMGDAAHAIVPFYGQGMNASLEDVRVFDEILNEHDSDWKDIFKKFQDVRYQNTNAIADLAIDNYYEMRDYVDDIPFIRKRKIEMQLEKQYPDYYSKYSLVTFQPELPYSIAMKKGRAQDQILLELCKREDFDQIPLNEYHRRLTAE